MKSLTNGWFGLGGAGITGGAVNAFRSPISVAAFTLSPLALALSKHRSHRANADLRNTHAAAGFAYDRLFL